MKYVHLVLDCSTEVYSVDYSISSVTRANCPTCFKELLNYVIRKDGPKDVIEYYSNRLHEIESMDQLDKDLSKLLNE